MKKQQQANDFRTELLRSMKKHNIQTLRVFGDRVYGYHADDTELFSFSRLENTEYPRFNLLNSDWLTCGEEKSSSV